MTTKPPREYDVVIIGGGPAGLCAAINGASEGLRVALLDTATTLGGQALSSYSIENYPMPYGIDDITGERLMSGFVDQALRFGTDIFNPCRAAHLGFAQGSDVWKVVTTDDFQEFKAKCVILSMGLSYRRLDAKDIGKFMGRGVYYGVPGNLRRFRKTVGVVGAANSAGQAILQLAQSAEKAFLFARSPLAKSMSTYLIDRIRSTPNIEVLEGVEIAEVVGEKRLSGVRLVGGDGTTIPLEKLFIYIGAVPHTAWLMGTLSLDKNRFILTDGDLPLDDGPFHACETSMPGVFAAGDVRFGQAVKRITGAVGDGITALQSCHRFCGSVQW